MCVIERKTYISPTIAHKFVLVGPVDNKSSLVQIVTGDTYLCLQGPLLLTWFNFDPNMDK